MIRKNNELTARERSAVEHYIKYGSKIEAYRHAYDTSNQNPSTQHRASSRVFDRPEVQQAILEAQSRQTAQFDMESHQIKQMLATVAGKCIKNKMDRMGNQVPVDPKAVVSALSEINRMNGNHAPVKSELTGAEGGPLVVRSLSDFYSDVEAESADA